MIVCQLNNELANCFQTGTAFCPLAVNSWFLILALLKASTKIGMLLEIAIKPVCKFHAKAGASRVN